MTDTRKTAAICLLALLWAVVICRLYLGGPHLDLSALYVAGWLAGDGQMGLIYAAPPDIFGAARPALWAETMARAGAPDQQVTAYVYPPIWAALLAWPAHALPPQTFFRAVFAWHVLAGLGSALLAWRLLPAPARRAPLIWAAALVAMMLLTVPGLNAYMLNQPQITVTLVTLLAFRAVQQDRQIAGGALLGLAAAFKLSPILLALIFVFNRQWRALAAALLVSGGIALASVLLLGWPLHAQFLAQLATLGDRIVLTKINYSPEMLLHQIAALVTGGEITDGRAVQTVTMAKPLWIALAARLGLLAAAAGVWAATRRLAMPSRLPLQLLGLSLAVALFGPLSWAHYFMLPALLLPALFAVMPPRRAALLIAAIALATSLPLAIVLHGFNHRIMATALVPVVAYLMLLAALLLAARAPGAGRDRPD